MTPTQRVRDRLVVRLSPYRLLFRLARRCPAPGFDVRVLWPEDGELAAAGAAVGAALALLAEHDLRRFACLRRDLPNVLVMHLPGYRAQCVARLQLCLIDAEYVRAPGTSAGRLAQTLVHEGAHARLLRAGIAYAPPAQARVEAICRGQEADFARRLPNGAALVAAASARRDTAARAAREAIAGPPRRRRNLPAVWTAAGGLGWLLAEVMRRGA